MNWSMMRLLELTITILKFSQYLPLDYHEY